jgi:hypothetical protein
MISFFTSLHTLSGEPLMALAFAADIGAGKWNYKRAAVLCGSCVVFGYWIECLVVEDSTKHDSGRDENSAS